MAQIGNFIIAQPQPDGIGNLVLVLMPAGEIEPFEEMGLRAGDRLVGVDNQPLGPDIAGGLERLAMTAGAASVTLSVEREGVVMPITISLSGGGQIE
jgi:type II secretory pathway component PulC